MADQLKPLYNIINRENTLTLAVKKVLRKLLRLIANLETVVLKTIVTESGSYLVSGSAIYDQGLTFKVTPCRVVIDDTPYFVNGGEVTLAAGDPSGDRWDLIVADISTNGPRVVQGTPDASPVKPELTPETQTLITEVFVPAAAAAPDVSVVDIYLNNAEWNTSAIVAGGAVDFDSSGPAVQGTYEGAKCIELLEMVAGDTLQFTSGTDYHVGELDMLEMQILCKSTWPPNKYLRAAWYNSGVRVSNWVKLTDYGVDELFDSTNKESYQVVGLSGSDFKYSDQFANTLIIETRGLGGGGMSMYIDRIRVHKGYQIANRHAYAHLDREQVWTRQQGFMAPSLVADGTDFSWDMTRGHVAEITVTANTLIANPTNIKAGATYVLKTVQGGAGGFQLSWGTAFKWVGGQEPLLTAAAGSEDVFCFVSFDGESLYGLQNVNYS